MVINPKNELFDSQCYFRYSITISALRLHAILNFTRYFQAYNLPVLLLIEIVTSLTVDISNGQYFTENDEVLLQFESVQFKYKTFLLCLINVEQ